MTNSFDPLDLAAMQDHWGELQIHTGVELMAAAKDKNQARIREVADVYADLRDQRLAYFTGRLRNWQPSAREVALEIEVDPDDLDNAPIALRLIAADRTNEREH